MRRIKERDEALIELFVAALQSGRDGLAHVLGLRCLQVGKVGVGREERDGDVEGVGDVILGGLHVGQGGKVAHGLGEELQLHAGLGDENFAAAAAFETHAPLGFQAVTLLFADDFVGRDQGGGNAAVLVDGGLGGGFVEDQKVDALERTDGFFLAGQADDARAVGEFELGLGFLDGLDGAADGAKALLDVAEVLAGLALAAADEQDESFGREEGGVQGQGAGGAGLAGATGAVEQDVAFAAVEEFALPGVGREALGGEDAGGVG